MIITLDERQKLHKLCFGDSDAYIDFFFHNFFDGNNKCDIVRDSRLVATLYWKNYELRVLGRRIPYQFIMGLCVHPEYRHLHLATELIQKYLATCEAPFVVLHPFLVEFYEKQDFYPFSFAEKKTCRESNPILTAHTEENLEFIRNSIDLAIKAEDRFDPAFATVSKPNFENSAAFLEFLAEKADGAVFDVINGSAGAVGYAVRRNDEIISYSLPRHYHFNDIIGYRGYRYFQMGIGAVFNQVRIANVEALLYHLPYTVEERCSFEFCLTDSQIPRNEGCYRVVLMGKMAAGVIRIKNNSAIPKLTMSDLCSILSGQKEKLEGDAAKLKKYFYSYQILDINQY